MGNATELKLMQYFGRVATLIPQGRNKHYIGEITYVDDVGFFVAGCAVEEGDRLFVYPKANSFMESEFTVKWHNDGLLERGIYAEDLVREKQMRELLEDVELDGPMTEFELKRDVGRLFYNYTTEQGYAPLVYRKRIGFYIGDDTVERDDIIAKKPVGAMDDRNPKIFKVQFINHGLIPGRRWKIRQRLLKKLRSKKASERPAVRPEERIPGETQLAAL